MSKKSPIQGRSYFISCGTGKKPWIPLSWVPMQFFLQEPVLRKISSQPPRFKTLKCLPTYRNPTFPSICWWPKNVQTNEVSTQPWHPKFGSHSSGTARVLTSLGRKCWEAQVPSNWVKAMVTWHWLLNGLMAFWFFMGLKSNWRIRFFFLTDLVDKNQLGE